MPTPLSVALERVRHASRPGSLVLVVSDFYQPGRRLQPPLVPHCVKHNDVIGCQVLDPAEEALPDGRYPISDGVHVSMMDTATAGGKRAYTAMSEEHTQAPQRLFQRHQCGWVTMRTPDDPVEVLGRDLRVLLGRAA